MTLSERQSQIMDFIKAFSLENGYPPTVREIGKAIGSVKDISTSVVDYNLKVLQRKGLIHRAQGVSRGIQLVEDRKRRQNITHLISVPLLGHIAAGQPIDVPEGAYTSDDMVEVPSDMLPKKTDNLYALTVQGDSMIDALINDGDTVIMKHIEGASNGEMVAVWLAAQEETTLKRFYHEGDRIRLQPENTTMEPIYVDPSVVRVQGKVVAVLRNLN